MEQERKWSRCHNNTDQTNLTPWGEFKNDTDIVYYFTNTGPIHCFSLDDIKNAYELTRPEYIRMNDQTRRKLFLLSHMNVSVDDSFIHGILKLSNVFYVYPRYHAIPEDQDVAKIVYTSIPISTSIFFSTTIDEIRNRINSVIDRAVIPVSLIDTENRRNILFGDGLVDEDD